MAITRSTASGFPYDYEEYEGSGPNAVTVPALGAAGDLLLIHTFVSAQVFDTITASNGLILASLGGQYNAALGLVQTFWTQITAATEGDTNVTFTAALGGTTPYFSITADEFTSDLGANTVWTPYAPVGLNNAASAAPVFPDLTTPASADELAYIAYMQLDGETPTGGTSPISGATFSYAVTSSLNLVAFGNVAPSTSYQPVAAAGGSAISMGLGAIWQATEASTFIKPPPALFSQAAARAAFR